MSIRIALLSLTLLLVLVASHGAAQGSARTFVVNPRAHEPGLALEDDVLVYLPLIRRSRPAPRPTSTPTPVAEWQTIFADDFEGDFPGAWRLSSNQPDRTWGRATCRAFSGASSVWPAATGSGALTPCVDNYPNNLAAWMVYGPFDLSDATAAEMTFQYWQRTERNADFFSWYASKDGVNFAGFPDSGDTGGWVAHTFDLSRVWTLGDLRGQPQVWVAFVLETDASNTDLGVFLDDVVIRKTTGGMLAPLRPEPETTPTTGSAVFRRRP